MSSQPVDKIRTDLLRYPDLFVSAEGSSDDIYQVYAKPSLCRSAVCPICNCENIQQRGHRLRKIRDYVLIDGIPRIINVEYHQRQYYCVSGGHYFLDVVDSYPPNETISKRLKRYIFFLYCCNNSRSMISKKTGISFKTVASIITTLNQNIRDMVKVSIKSPTYMVIRKLVVDGKPYTVIANLDEATLVYFFTGSPASVLSAIENDSPIIPNEFFCNTEVVLVDAKCDYENALRKRINPLCKITVDPSSLNKSLFDDFINTAKRNLSYFKSSKLEMFIVPSHIIEDQKEYNFINRMFREAPELKEKYAAINAFAEHSTSIISSQTLSMGKAELIDYLEENGYVPENTANNTLTLREFNDNAELDDFESLCETIKRDIKEHGKNQDDIQIESRLYFCVQNTFKEKYITAKGSHERVPCLEDTSEYAGGNYWYLGKDFYLIEENLKYKNDYIAGLDNYSGLNISY